MEDEDKLTVFFILRNVEFYDNIPRKGLKSTRMRDALYDQPKAKAKFWNPTLPETENIEPQFNLFIRWRCGNGCDFKHQIIDYWGNDCFIQNNVFCFIKCINHLTTSDYKEKNWDIIRNEQRQSNILSMARIQPCLRIYGIF